MKPRLIILAVAIVLAGVTALGVNAYLSNIKKQAVEDQKTVQVLVTTKDIAKGTTIEDIQKNHLAELREIPRRYVAAQAISSTRNIEGQALSVGLSAGEQLTASKFKYPSEAGLSFTVPKDFIAVSVPYDDIKGVAGMVKPGDLLTVFATFSPGANGENVTKILLQKAQVLAIGTKVGTEREDSKGKAIATAEASSDSAKEQKTVTLTLSPADAEKLVFAQENGKVWFGLHPTSNAARADTKGVTIKTVFK